MKKTRTPILPLALAFLTGVAACDTSSEPPASQTPTTVSPAQAPQRRPSDIPPPPDVAAAPADAVKTVSGLAYKVITPGTGTDHPKASDAVKVHYTGWMTNGEMFDSSHKRNQPATFPLSGVIKGWTEGVQLMVEGEKARFWIPGDLAYGNTPGRPGHPYGTLVFDIELLEIIRPLPPPQVPKDVAGPPASATKTASGLAYRVLKPGKGTRKPTRTSTVEVHYSGWMTNGEMFDSSVTRGTTTSFRLDRVIKGWTEGLQLMVEGEKTRFWIPGELAYGNEPSRPGRPYGMLVFDVELIKIQ